MDPFTFEELPMAVTKLCQRMKKIEKLLKLSLQLAEKKEDLMDIEEAAQYLRLSITTVYSKVCRREIPANKQGKKLYFSRGELKDWISNGKIRTPADFVATAEAYLKENKLGGARKGKVNGD